MGLIRPGRQGSGAFFRIETAAKAEGNFDKPGICDDTGIVDIHLRVFWVAPSGRGIRYRHVGRKFSYNKKIFRVFRRELHPGRFRHGVENFL